MANRRMFNKTIISSAKFIKMPPSTQMLYFHLGMNADDDGVVEAFSIMRMIGSNEDDIKILTAKKFIIILNEDLVSFITDWNEHNLIRADRKIDSKYKNLLIEMVKEQSDDNQMTTKRQPNDNQMSAQDRLGKVSKGKIRLGKVSIKKKRLSKDNSKAEYGNPLINSFIKVLKEFTGLATLDKTQTINRRYAYLLIKNKITPEFKKRANTNPTDEQLILSLQAILSKTKGFHKKNITNFKYFYGNFGAILSEIKGNQITIIG